MKETSQIEIFKEIYEERPHISELSGERIEYQIDTPLWRSLFMHVLPKGRFPLLRTSKDNILLGTPTEHTLIDNGTEEQREEYRIEKLREGVVVRWSVFYNKQDKLKKQYPNV